MDVFFLRLGSPTIRRNGAPEQKFASGQLKADRERLKSFTAGFDRQPFHLNEEAARGGSVSGLGGERLAYRGDDHAPARGERAEVRGRKPHRPEPARFAGLSSQIRSGAAWTRDRTSSLPPLPPLMASTATRTSTRRPRSRQMRVLAGILGGRASLLGGTDTKTSRPGRARPAYGGSFAGRQMSTAWGPLPDLAGPIPCRPAVLRFGPGKIPFKLTNYFV